MEKQREKPWSRSGAVEAGVYWGEGACKFRETESGSSQLWVQDACAPAVWGSDLALVRSMVEAGGAVLEDIS